MAKLMDILNPTQREAMLAMLPTPAAKRVKTHIQAPVAHVTLDGRAMCGGAASSRDVRYSSQMIREMRDGTDGGFVTCPDCRQRVMTIRLGR